nr:hypothetical protein [Horticoccus luteus]
MFAQCRLAVAGVFAILLLAAGCTSTPRGVPAAEGIANFGRITPTLWRGAQPSERGLENLAKLGVVRIINLRMPDDVIPAEASTARRLGMDYENVPLPGLSAPDAMAVARVLALIDSAGGRCLSTASMEQIARARSSRAIESATTVGRLTPLSRKQNVMACRNGNSA